MSSPRLVACLRHPSRRAWPYPFYTGRWNEDWWIGLGTTTEAAERGGHPWYGVDDFILFLV